jgi:HD-GYP domain-containing protein (c-di-GMP phosphodiesterase class II)
MPIKNEILYNKLKKEAHYLRTNALSYFNLALFLDDSNEYKEAISNYEKAILIKQDLYQAYLYLGIDYTILEDFDQAAVVWKKIMDSDTIVQYEKLSYKERSDQIRYAFEKWSENYKQNSSDFNLKILTGIAFITLGNTDKAKNIFEEVLKNYSSYEKANFYRGYCDYILKNYESALHYFKIELNVFPNDFSCGYFYARCNFESGKYAQAIQILKNLIKQKPNSIETLILLGKCYSKTAGFEQSIEFFRKVISLDPNIAEVHFETAQIFEKQFQMDKAITEYLTAINLKSDHKESYFRLGIVYKNLGKPGPAIEQFNKALDIDPMDGEVHYYCGESNLQLGRYKDAIDEYKEAVLLNPNHSYAYYSMGKAFFKLRNYAESINVYKKAVDLNPKDSSVLNALGLSYFISGQLSLAVEQFKKVLKENPNDPYAHYYLGTAFFKMNYIDEAIDEYHIAAKSNPNSPYTKFAIAASFLINNDIEKAIDAFQKASESIPSSDQDLALLSILQLFVSIGIESAKLYTKLENSYLNTVRSLAKSIDARDPYTQYHSERVSKISSILAKKLNLSGKQIKEIEIAGHLHDIGKLGIPDNILLKEGNLTEEEKKIMETHPCIGENIIKDIQLPWDIKDLIKHHHEKHNGTGYPDKLAKEDIPFGAQIIALADFYDALTTDRPYRKALTHNETIAKIENLRNKHFNSEILDAFLEIADQIQKTLK